ncbi:DNA polymerase Y family protein [Nocardia nova]|uniref:DNA polymerase Y family protein n=1 Tax=Nocardia nova TaxID=37330 RepID=UPI00046CFC4D|nr:DNA polymerase Y family protein [Nocardia nova]
MKRPGFRVLAVWCPDWPAVAAAAAADIAPLRPVVVLHANRVVACSAAAREAGVRRGLTRREAQARCPELHVAQSDPDRDARLFEPVVTAVDETVPGVEVLRPGLLVLGARGAARYFGSEEQAAERLVDAVAATGVECRIGIADELSAAVIAARRAQIVASGAAANFLAPLPVGELAVEPALAPPERGELVDLLRRLGLRRIGDFAALTPAEVASRFGADAIRAHRCARAEPERPPSAAPPAPDLVVEYHCDPPIERVDAAAFAGRMLAARLHDRLSAAAMACTRLAVHAETGDGEHLSRIWRCAQPLTPETTADRVRWQLDGWLTHRALTRRTDGGNHDEASDSGSPITLLRLEPVEVVTAGALQLGLWGGVGEEEQRARRALVRVQGLLGGEAVRIGVRSGGRGPVESVTLVTFGEEAIPATDPDQPWPGRLPQPAPVVVLSNLPEVRLEAVAGQVVWVTERGVFTAEPAVLHWGNRSWRIIGWAGPWLVDERWWGTGDSGETVRAQILLDEQERALLLLGYEQVWHVEGLYE